MLPILRKISKSKPCKLLVLVGFIAVFNRFLKVLISVSSPTVNPTPESIRPALLMNACDFNDSVFKNWDLGNQSDPHLLQLIKSTVLLKYEDPEQSKNSDVVGMFDLLDNYFDPSDGSFMKRYIIPRFFAQYTKPGLFVEAGSSNGKHLSTSFYLEKRLGWTGVLVEPSPEWDPLSSARRLKRGNSLNAGICLAPQPTPCRATLSVDTDSLGGGRGTILPYHIDEEALGRYQTQVDCFPLFAVLAAAGMTQVDFLSLDLEGVEAWVLWTVPWDKVDFKVVRIHNAQLFGNAMPWKFIVDFMTMAGYEHHTDILPEELLEEEQKQAIFSRRE